LDNIFLATLDNQDTSQDKLLLLNRQQMADTLPTVKS